VAVLELPMVLLNSLKTIRCVLAAGGVNERVLAYTGVAVSYAAFLTDRLRSSRKRKAAEHEQREKERKSHRRQVHRIF
jgi:hypothetical protein